MCTALAHAAIVENARHEKLLILTATTLFSTWQNLVSVDNTNKGVFAASSWGWDNALCGALITLKRGG